jgi:hypothetical protein
VTVTTPTITLITGEGHSWETLHTRTVTTLTMTMTHQTVTRGGER